MECPYPNYLTQENLLFFSQTPYIIVLVRQIGSIPGTRSDTLVEQTQRQTTFWFTGMVTGNAG